MVKELGDTSGLCEQGVIALSRRCFGNIFCCS